FALAQLNVSHLRGVTCKADINTQLKDLSTTLPAVYYKTLERINAQPPLHTKLAVRTLSLLMSVFEPLTFDQLREALSINAAEQEDAWNDRRPPLAIVLEACMGLAKIDETAKTVHLFHLSVREYLATINLFEEACTEVPRNCIASLRRKSLAHVSSSTEELEARKENAPFAVYAARFWHRHVKGRGEDELQSVLKEFLSRRPEATAFVNTPASRLHQAAEKRDDLYLRHLIQHGADVNTTDEEGNTALHYAARSGGVQVAEHLLAAGVDVGARNSVGQTAEEMAQAYGNVDVVFFLRNRGRELRIGSAQE
ncbi:ankyrin repeat-containing domain protein, partial [Pyrenochaeta sp. MPI-SDFR-AT-0127]